jgi:hypothetical protein
MTAAKTMPKWLADKLILDGVMTSDRVTKHARPRRCPTCHLYTILGLDEFPHRVAVDPLPTTSAGELFALLTGRRSFALDAGELYERTAGRLLFRPADTHPVYATHQCGSLPLPVNERFMPKPQEKQDGPPPF